MKSKSIYPALKLLLPIIIGISFWWVVEDRYKMSIFYLLFFTPFFYYYLQAPLKNLSTRIIFSILGFICLAWFSYQMTCLYSNASKCNNQWKDLTLMGKVVDLKQTNKKLRCIVSIQNLDQEHITDFPTKAFVYIAKDESIDIGDQIIWKGSLYPILSSKNPGDFNFKQFAKRKNIYMVSYPKIWDVKSSKGLVYHLNIIKFKIESYLKQHIPERSDLSMAILLGDKSAVDQEKMEHFQTAGLMHLMAVSGMHAGIFFSLIWLVLKLCIPFFNNKKLLINGLALVAMWIFIGICGIPPSAIRAGIMITIYLIASLIQKTKQPLNILGFTALIMLIVNPFQLFQLSFQFSFLAMFGILVVFPALKSKVVYNKYWVVNKLIDAGLITLSAQIILSPVILFYFKEFPTYFLLSSILTLPLVPIIMASGIGVVASAHLLPSIITLFTFIHDSALQGLMTVADGISNLPFSKLSLTHFSFIHLILLGFLFLIFLHIIISSKVMKHIPYLGFGVLFVLGSGWINPDRQIHSMTIYHNRNHLVIDFFDQDNCYTINDQSPDSYFNYSQKAWRTQQSIENVIPLDSSKCLNTICRAEGFIKFYDQLFWILEDSRPIDLPFKKIDLLIVNTRENFDLEQIHKQTEIICLILPSHLSKSRNEKLKLRCDELGIAWYSIGNQGAFEQKIISTT